MTVVAANGYATLERRWQEGDVVELRLPMPARLTAAHPRIDATRASVAIERGPLVYCLEQCDQEAGVDVLDVEIDERAPLKAVWREDLLGGVVAVEAQGQALEPARLGLYVPLARLAEIPRRPARLVAIPYYAWANREPGAMRVWIPRQNLS